MALRRGRRAAAAALAAAVLVSVPAAALLLAPPAGASESFAPPVTIDGPSADVVSLGGVDLAQDGSGAVVYTKLVGGVAHVFASLERAGAWSAPAQVDAAVAAAASAPAVAVADGGRTAVVWIAGGSLYGAVLAAGTTAFSAPQPIAPASGTPALGMGTSGTAYVTYLGPAANVVDVARLDRTATAFAVLPAPMSADPIALPSAGAGPAITVAADATGVVAWAQVWPDGTTHVLVRRVSAAGPSPVLDDATATTLGGAGGGSADSPALGVTYDSSDAWLAFRETVGGSSRVIVEKLLGDELRPPALADSLPAAPGQASAAAPSLAVNGNAQGLLACGLVPANALSVAALGSSTLRYGWTAGTVVSAASSAVAPAPVAALSADGEGVVAFAPAAGALDAELLHDGKPLAATPIVTAALGAIVPAGGISASADDHGDLLVGFAAGAPGSLAIAVEPIVESPSAPRATGTQRWSTDNRPVLRWRPSASHWSAPAYAVYLDGAKVATTPGTSYAVPAALADGRHSWKVVATNTLGPGAPSQTRRLLIDVAPPALALDVTGSRHAGGTLTFAVGANTIAGLRAVSIDYGDGSSSTQLRSNHAYARRGSYLVSVVATDRAGVSADLRERVSIS
jgi:PKD domain